MPYVKTLSSRAPSRRLDPGYCTTTTGLSIRGPRIVQVTDYYADFNAAESLVRELDDGGGPARVLARAAGGLGGYGPFASPSQSATSVFLARIGNRQATVDGFLRLDLVSKRLRVEDPIVPLAGAVSTDGNGLFWYVQAPSPPEAAAGFGPFCTSKLEPCRLIHASASPFSNAVRTLQPELSIKGSSGGLYETGLFTDPFGVSGDLTRAVVRGGTLVRRDGLPGIPVSLLRSDELIYSPEAEETQPVGPFTPTGQTATTDAVGHWSLPVGARPPAAYFAGEGPRTGVASQSVAVYTAATVASTASGRSLTGTVTPARPGRTIQIQRLENDGEGNLPNGRPRCRTNTSGPRVCDDAAWSTLATVPLDAGGTTFATTVAGPGFYRAKLPLDPNALTPGADPTAYPGESPELHVTT